MSSVYRFSCLLPGMVALLSLGLLLTAGVEKPAPTTPNVVLFFMDDAGRITATVTDHALAFIRKHKSKPFLLYVPHPLPHVPLATSAAYRGKTARGIFGDVMTELDASVGQILGELKKQGLDNNTLVLFISDNGPLAQLRRPRGVGRRLSGRQRHLV